MACSLWTRSRPFLGRNPSKQKRSLGSPLTTRAATSAEGPGTASTRAPAAAAAATSLAPGSDMAGVPASVTTATSTPRSSRRSTWSTWAASLWSWTASSSLPETPAWVSRRRVWRVSSQAITPTRARVAAARGERSPRLPIGVETRTRVPVGRPAPVGRAAPVGPVGGVTRVTWVARVASVAASPSLPRDLQPVSRTETPPLEGPRPSLDHAGHAPLAARCGQLEGGEHFSLPDQPGHLDRSDVETDLEDVAVDDLVILAFHPQPPGCFGGCPRSELQQLVPANHLGPDEPALQIR